MGFAAALHLIAAIPGAGYLLRDVSFAPLRESILREPICIQEGFAHVPDGPGLGIDLNWERVLEHTT